MAKNWWESDATASDEWYSADPVDTPARVPTVRVGAPEPLAPEAQSFLADVLSGGAAPSLRQNPAIDAALNSRIQTIDTPAGPAVMADSIPSARRQVIEPVRPDRTFGELATDIGTTFRNSAREGVASLAKAPVSGINAINTGFNSAADALAGLFGQTIPADQRVGMMEQPGFVRSLDESGREINANDYRMGASGALMFDDANQPQDVRGTLRYLYENPGAILTDISRTAGAMLPTIIPGAQGTSIALQAAEQAQQTADAVEANLLADGVAPAQAKAAAAEAFTAALGVGVAAPRMFEGGTALESLLTGTSQRGTGSAAARILTPLAGEAGSEAVEEGSIQGVQNAFSGDPLGQGVGAAAARGGLLGLLMGGPTAALEGVDAARGPVAEEDGLPRGYGAIPDNTRPLPARTALSDAIGAALAGPQAPLPAEPAREAPTPSQEPRSRPVGMDDATKAIDSRLSALRELASAGRLTPAEVDGLQKQDAAIREELARQESYRAGVLPATPEARLDDAGIAALDRFRVGIRDALEAHRASQGYEGQLGDLERRRGGTDTDEGLLRIGRALMGVDTLPESGVQTRPSQSATIQPLSEKSNGEVVQEGQGAGKEGVQTREEAGVAGQVESVKPARTKPAESETAPSGPSFIDWDALDAAMIGEAPASRATAQRVRTGDTDSDISAALGPAAKGVTVVRSVADLPADVASRVGITSENSAGIEGFYDPETGTSFVIEDGLDTEHMNARDRKVWVAAHERTGHAGLRGLLTDAKTGTPGSSSGLRNMLDRASQNATVAAVAKAMESDRPERGSRLVEEAIVELGAAVETGNYQHIADRYGVTVTPAMQDTLKGYFTRLIAAIKKSLGFGENFSDADVYRLIRDSSRYARENPTPRRTKSSPAPRSTRKSLPESGSLGTPRIPTTSEMRRLSRVEEIQLDDNVRSVQRDINWDGFRNGRHPGALIEGYGDIPVAIRRRDGEILIYDGNHRVVTAMNDGVKSMRMHVIDASDFDPEVAGRPRQKNETIEDDEAILRELGIDTESSDSFVENASGESSASVEAINRDRDEREAGQVRMLIDRDGSVRQLRGVDAVDTFARDGQVIVQRGIGRDEWTVLSKGRNVSDALAQGRINAAREALNEPDEEAIASRRAKPPVDQTETKAFKKWSGGAEVFSPEDIHSYDGGPSVFRLYHGTTGDFDVFDNERANVESDMGAGFYFSNTTDDVGANYAGLGPDLTNKVEREAERIANETDREYNDKDVVAEARAKFMQNEGATMQVFVRAKNPAILGGNDETKFTFEEPYDEETDEYGEPTGTLLDFIENLREAAGNYSGGDVETAIVSIMDEASDGDISLSKVHDKLKESEEFGYYTDDEGNIVSNEIFRQALEWSGYDAIVDYTINDKFGNGKMRGVDQDTVHVIAFDPKQIKSATGNSGAFDTENPSIIASRSGKSIVADGRLLSLIDEVKAAGGDISAIRDAVKARSESALIKAIDDALAAMQPKARVTGTKNAVTDAERAAAGRNPVLRDALKSNEETLEEALQTIKDNPSAGPEAVAKLWNNGAGGVSLIDEAVMLVYKTQLIEKRDNAAAKLSDPNASDAVKEVARNEWNEAEAAINALDIAAVNAGREWGRFGQFRARMLRDDFTLTSLERKERARLERPLTMEESAKVKELAKTIADMQKRYDALQARVGNAASESAYEATVKRLSRPQGRRMESLRRAADAARKRLNETASIPSKQGQSGAVLDPRVLADYAIIGAYHIANGANKLADWVAEMRSDIGERFDAFKADHPRIFKAAQEQLDKPIKAEATVAEVMADIDLANVTPKDVRKLIEAYIGEGLRGEPAVIGAAAKSLGMDEAEVRELFVKTERREPTMSEARQELADLRKIVRLQNEIDRLEAGQPKPPAGARREDSSAVAAKKVELAELRKSLKPIRDPEGRYQEMRGKQIAKRIDELHRRIEVGDFASRPRVPKALNEANTRAQIELDKAKEAFLTHQYYDMLSKRSRIAKIFGGVGQTFNLSRAVMTSLDLSALLRQGGFLTLSHPVRGTKAFFSTLPALLSETNARKFKAEIESRDNARLYKKYGLELTGIGTGVMSQIEENYASRWLDNLPTWTGAGLVRGSGRVYAAMLNRLRADSFDAMVASLTRNGESTEAEGKAIANFINVATGRGKIGSSKADAGRALNTLFFAPRLVASRFQLLAGQPLYGGSNRTRRLIAMDYARYLIGVSVVTSLVAYGLSDDDEDWRDMIGLDPRSANFGKIKFGDTFLDPLSGLGQVSTFLARILTGETVNAAGAVKPLRRNFTLTDLRRAFGADIPAHKLKDDGSLPYGSRDARDVIFDFMNTKFAPVPGAIVNAVSGSDMIGQPTTPAKEALGLVTPMSFNDISKIMEEQGVQQGTAMFMLSLLGMGMQYRGKNESQATADDLKVVDAVKTDIEDALAAQPVEKWQSEFAQMKKQYAPILDGVEIDMYEKDGKYGKAGQPRMTKDGKPVLTFEGKGGVGSVMGELEGYPGFGPRGPYTTEGVRDRMKALTRISNVLSGAQPMTRGAVVKLTEGVQMQVPAAQALYDAGEPDANIDRKTRDTIIDQLKFLRETEAKVGAQIVREAKDGKTPSFNRAKSLINAELEKKYGAAK